MYRRKQANWIPTLFITLALMALALPAVAQEDAAGWVQNAQGEAFIKSQMDEDPRPATVDSPVLVTDTLLTEDGTLQIMLRDETIVALAPDSEILLSEAVFADDGSGSLTFDFVSGAARVLTGGMVKANPEAFKVQTPLGRIGVRGTEYGVFVEDDREVTLLVEGGPVLYTDTQASQENICTAIAAARVDAEKSYEICDGYGNMSATRKMKTRLGRLNEMAQEFNCVQQ